jgi:uncharacterized membrane protein YbhN (UPF0104 family)
VTAHHVAATTPSPDSSPGSAASSGLWRAARVLLLGALVAFVAAAALAFWPVANPGVQDCGSPALYAVHNDADVRVAGPGAADEPADATRLRAQPRCRVRVDQSLSRAAVALGLGIVLGLTGAALGLIDDRRTLARAPRFESLLRERPPEVPAEWDQPVIPEQDLGTRLPDLEWEEIRVVLGVGLLTLVVLAWITPWPSVRAAFGHASLGWLVTALAVVALTYPLAAAETLAFTDGLRSGWQAFTTVLRAAVASSFTGRLLPEYGPDGLTVHQLVRAGVPRAEAVRRISVLDALAVGAHAALVVGVGLATVVLGPSTGMPLARGWIAWLVVAVLVVAGLVTAPRRYRNRVIRPDRQALDALQAADPVALLPSALAAVVLAVVNGVVVVALVHAFGGSGSWMAVLLASLLAGVAVAVAPTPDGVGLVEPVLALGLIGAGVDAGPAVATVIMWRLLVFWAPMAPGWLAYRRLRDEGVL